jgi:hypothetical protein
MTTATQSSAKQIKLITRANVEHSSVAARVLEQLRDVRQIADRNARDVKDTRGGTEDLIKHAEELASIAKNGRGAAGANGRRARTNGR